MNGPGDGEISAMLAVRAMEFGERLARAMGAGFIYGLATLKIPHMQLALERAGLSAAWFRPWVRSEDGRARI